MGQRNIQCTSQMIDLEMEQRNQGYMLPEPCVILGGVTSFSQPVQTIVRASANTSSLDPHQHYESAMFYGMPHYHGVHHHAANEIGVATESNIYVPYMPTPSSGIPVNHGSSDQMPSSSNFGAIGVSVEEHGRNSHFTDNVRGSYKRKNTEGIPGSFQHLNFQASSSSSVAPLQTRHPDGATPMDAASFSLPQFRRNGTPSIRELESQRIVRNRLVATDGMDPVLAHSHNHYFQGNFFAQPFQPTGWVELQYDGGASAWSQAPAIPYMHGSNVSGVPMESGSMVVHRYRETAGNRSSSTFLPPLNIRQNSFHLPSHSVQGVKNQNTSVHPQVAAGSYRVPSSYSAHSSMNVSQDGLEMIPRHMRPVPPTGFRIHRSPREGPVPDATSRQSSLPHLRVPPSDGVALLEISDFYEVGNFIDHHRDLRLDIEDMSYEELLALGERIGNVNTGLSEEIISSQLKTRMYVSARTNINQEEPPSAVQESGSCSICQEDYRDHEKIATLDCGHEYHSECLKKWLFLKNVCPICKSETLATKS